MTSLFRQVVVLAGAMAFFPVVDASASLITTLNFTDGNWSTTLSQSDTGGSAGTNVSTATSTTITADKTGGTTGVRIVVDLTGSISTVGYENITLRFVGTTTSTLEWDGDLTAVVSRSDGLRITGSGIDIDANGISGTTAETEFAAGTTFPTANFGSDFAFDASADNGSVSALTFTLQVNANPEVLALSGVQLHGTALVPEPSSALAAALLCGGAIVIVRRRPVQCRQ